jgi:hypothetical protein
MLERSDELFDHKEGMVKTRSLALWENEIVIRHAQLQQFVSFREIGQGKRRDR